MYGGSAGRKKDSALRANGADWKNTQNQALLSSSPTKGGKPHEHHCSKTKHYQ
jgi:hypothetical protein